AIDNDFADLFEIKGYVRDRSAAIVRTAAENGSEVRLTYVSDGHTTETTVRASPAGRIDGGDLVWDLDLPPKEDWGVDLHIPMKLGPLELQPTRSGFGDQPQIGEDPLSRWLADLPRFESDSHILERVVATSAADLAALRISLDLPDELGLPDEGK